MSGYNIAFIPFRSGSTRLKDKNIKLLSGLPLTAWSLIAACKTPSIDCVVLSTDSDDYFDFIVKNTKKHIPINKEIYFDKRSEQDASSNKKIFDYIKESLSKDLVSDQDTLIQLLPTSPFRSCKQLEIAIALSKKENKNLFAAVEYDFRLSFAFEFSSNGFRPREKESPMLTGNTQSQTHKEYFHPCGAFNILKMSDVRSNMKTIYDGAFPFKVSIEEGLDIDTPDDFRFMDSIASIFYKRLLHD